jgi:hypothetical protein
MKGNASRAVFGLLIVALGCLVFAKNAGYIINLSFNGWWTLFIILPCLASMITNGIKMPNTAGLLIGLYFLSREQHWLPRDFEQKFFWAGVLILFGLWVLFGSFSHGSVFHGRASTANTGDFSDRPEYIAIFCGNDIRNNSPELKGAKLTAIFGGLDVNMEDAVPAGNIRIEANAIFGGIDIVAPKNANIVLKGVPIFGGCENAASKPFDPSLPTVTIEAAAIFGGVDVK